MAKKKEEEYQLITHKSPKSPIAEAYRTLRTNLGFTEMDSACRSIMVSSANPNEGKSTVIANLAVVMAQAGNKVILVDCDLRRPIQHKIFGVENYHGFTNSLLQKTDIEEIAYQGLVDNLTVLTSGPIPPNPSEILGSEHTCSLWASLLEKYDYVFIDSPPVLAVADASILSTQVDGVILVVKAAETRTDMVREAKEQLKKANARLIGVVLNQVKIDSQDYHHYYYYYSNDNNNKKTGLRL